MYVWTLYMYCTNLAPLRPCFVVISLKLGGLADPLVLNEPGRMPLHNSHITVTLPLHPLVLAEPDRVLTQLT